MDGTLQQAEEFHPDPMSVNSIVSERTMAVLYKAVALADKIPDVLIATAGAEGLPHLASAAKLRAAPGGRVVLAEWFCAGALSNLQQNPRIAVVVWDSATDVGYQLLGEVESIDELSILDGYTPEQEAVSAFPQVERRLVVRVDEVLSFSRGPHSDVPE
jgi:hypothetical protein